MLWFWLVPTVVAVLVLGAGLIWLAAHGGLSFPWLQFYTRGKEAGFRLAELHVLRRAAVESELENPLVLFSSVRVLDACLRTLLTRYRARALDEDPGVTAFISELFGYRRRIEFNLPRYRSGLRSTREVSAGQRLRLVVPGVGTFQSQVVENLRRYLAVSYPTGQVLSNAVTWKGLRLNAYFWRLDDAGYSFETKVLDDFLQRQFPILYIAHSEDLIRSQKRTSVRVATDLGCQIYHLGGLGALDESWEKAAGYRARLVDLSEDGCALLVGGRAKIGLALKVQFALGGKSVVMNGTIRGITFDEKRNRSVLHVEALRPSDRTRIVLLGYVYDLFGDRKSDAVKQASKASAGA